MHLIKRSREVKLQDFIKTESVFAVPGHRRTANRRYDATGKFIGMSKPAPVIDLAAQKKVREAQAEGEKAGKPAPEQPFDMRRYQPLPGRVLLSRGPWIKEEKGVALPEDKWRHVFWWVVEKIGEGVTACAVGDHIICGRGFRPKEAWIGKKFYIAYQQAVVGIVESI